MKFQKTAVFFFLSDFRSFDKKDCQPKWNPNRIFPIQRDNRGFGKEIDEDSVRVKITLKPQAHFFAFPILFRSLM